MRFLFVTISAAMLLVGCASTYQQNVKPEGKKLQTGASVVVATPDNGFYENQEYANSGKMTANAVRAAFAPYSDEVAVSTECKDHECLSSTAKWSGFEYFVVPEIMHWEERATEWSGKPDRIRIKLSVIDGATGELLTSTIFSGKSKWATLGGDHPQDLLPEPLSDFVTTSY